MHPHMLVGGGVLCKACTVLTSWLLHPPGVNQSPYGCEWLCVWGGGVERQEETATRTPVSLLLSTKTQKHSAGMFSHTWWSLAAFWCRVTVSFWMWGFSSSE